MNNFEMHEQAQELADTLTPYSLARRVLELEQALKKSGEVVPDTHPEKSDYLDMFDTDECVEDPDAPEGTTHIDLNDHSDSRYLKVDAEAVRYYVLVLGGEDCWMVFNPNDHKMNVVRLERS